MALVSCPECAKEISSAAASCPSCGHPMLLAAAPAAEPPQPRWNRGAAAVLSLVIPGAGQMYKGQVFGGLVWLLFVGVGYAAFVVPGIVLHLCCIGGAASGDPTR